MQRIKNMYGQKIGKWTVVGEVPLKGKNRGAHWLCRCECGIEAIICGGTLRAGGSHGCTDCANGLRPFEALYNFLSRTAKARCHLFSITFSDFLKLTKITDCFYCGSQISWSSRNRKGSGRQTNLDRLDNTKGYSPDNVVVACAACNRLRGDRFSYEEFSQVVALLMENKLWPREGKLEQKMNDFRKRLTRGPIL